MRLFVIPQLPFRYIEISIIKTSGFIGSGQSRWASLSTVPFGENACRARIPSVSCLRHLPHPATKSGDTATISPHMKSYQACTSMGAVTRYCYLLRRCAFFIRLKLRISEIPNPSSVRAVPSAAIQVICSCSTRTAVITVTTGTR